MHEFHRQQYLEAMGLTVLTPSFILPEAKASQPFDYLDTEAVLDSSTVEAKTSATSVVDIASTITDTPSANTAQSVSTAPSVNADPLANTVPAVDHIPEEAAFAPQRTSPPENPSVEVSSAVEQILDKTPQSVPIDTDIQSGIGNQPFTLAILFIDGQYMVIDEIPQGQVFSLHQEQFYKELLYAVGIPTRTYHREMFSWPLKTKSNTSNSVLNAPNAAQDLFDGYLRANWPQQQPQKAVFCLGEHSVKLWDNSAFAQQCQDDNEELSLFVSGISSFTAMMDWTKKPVLWQQLQKQLQQQSPLVDKPS